MPSKQPEPEPVLPLTSNESIDEDPSTRRAHILEELQSTERHFLARMQHLLQDYHAPLKARAKSSDPLLNMYQVNTLFPRSLEVIVKAHEMFYAALEAAREEDIPKILLKYVCFLILFTEISLKTLRTVIPDSLKVEGEAQRC